jgi:hypothetical protein
MSSSAASSSRTLRSFLRPNSLLLDDFELENEVTSEDPVFFYFFFFLSQSFSEDFDP